MMYHVDILDTLESLPPSSPLCTWLGSGLYNAKSPRVHLGQDPCLLHAEVSGLIPDFKGAIVDLALDLHGCDQMTTVSQKQQHRGSAFHPGLKSKIKM